MKKTIKSDVSDVALKNDGDKDERFELIPVKPLRDVAKVVALGARKYGDNNWRKGDKQFRIRLMGALLRHVYAYMEGEVIDKESGVSHLAHVVTNAMFIQELQENEKD